MMVEEEVMSLADIEAGLRRQHLELVREGYDGHNRHSGITTMHDFGKRRSRRVWHLRLKEAAHEYNTRPL